MRRYLRAVAASITLVSACKSDSTSPQPAQTTGTLDFNIVTTGVDVDADGFLLEIDYEAPRPIPSNGSLNLLMTPGTHALRTAVRISSFAESMPSGALREAVSLEFLE